MIFKTLSRKIKNNKIYRPGPAIDKNVINNHINNSFISRLTGKNPTTDRKIYASRNPYGGPSGFPRSSSCWLNGVSNISCFSPAQLSGANWMVGAGTLISPRHILLAKHFFIALISGGTPILFVDDDSNIVTRKIIKYEFDPFADIAIGLLDSDMPSNIKFAKVLPLNYSTYMSLSETTPVYGLALDAEEKAIPKRVDGLEGRNYDKGDGSPLIPIPNILFNNLSSNDQFFSFTETLVAGDSGNPGFLIIDNELVVLTAFWFSTSGPFISIRYNDVNTFMNKLGGGYNLTPIDLEYVYNKYK